MPRQTPWRRLRQHHQSRLCGCGWTRDGPEYSCSAISPVDRSRGRGGTSNRQGGVGKGRGVPLLFVSFFFYLFFFYMKDMYVRSMYVSGRRLGQARTGQVTTWARLAKLNLIGGKRAGGGKLVVCALSWFRLWGGPASVKLSGFLGSRFVDGPAAAFMAVGS